jgi:N-acyl-D-amino-acid deacylase
MSFFLFFISCLPHALDADVVLRGGTVYDGSGQKPVLADVAIKGDRIVAIGPNLVVNDKAKVLDVKGMIVAPGFIDLHTHSDAAISQPGTRNNVNYVMQGVTTIVTGNCGMGPIRVGDFYLQIERNGAGSNVAHLIPHNDVRRHVMGNVNREPTDKELEQMKAVIDQGMNEGAWGMSTGLYYTPGSYAKTNELVELSKTVALRRGIYASHIRDEFGGLLGAIQEVITIGQKAKLPVHVSHMKAAGRGMWGKSSEALALIEQARSRGLKITADQYPYAAGSTSLEATVLPLRYRDGSRKEILARLDDPQVRAAMQELLKRDEDGKAIRIARYLPRPDWQGKDLAAIAAMEKKTPLEIAIEIERNGGAQIVHFIMHEQDVRLIMKQDFVATASDGGAMVVSDTVPHPRSYGCFPRKIGHYCLAEQLLPLEQALRSATGLPADILQLPERGYLKQGYHADIVVFDPATFRDTATYEKPHQYAIGLKHLFVNGQMTVADGKYNGALAGRALRKTP